jgi:hypothetical protein
MCIKKPLRFIRPPGQDRCELFHGSNDGENTLGSPRLFRNPSCKLVAGFRSAAAYRHTHKQRPSKASSIKAPRHGSAKSRGIGNVMAG